MEMIGISNANAKPLAALKPTLSPVYEPGPMDTDIADKSLKLIEFSSNISSIIRLILFVCILDSKAFFTAIRLPEFDSAVEHTLVAVSICRIFPISFFFFYRYIRSSISRLANMKKLTLLIIVLAFNQCTSEFSSTTSIDKVRAHDPWVFRSVLDQVPRVITIALDSNAWVSYFTDKASMYKVWNGGVSFEGAVYDYAHGPQPSSYGYSYSINKYEKPWSIRNNGEEISVDIDYKGHRFENGRVYINYDLLATDGGVIHVSESPEIISNDKQQRIFNRRFKVSGLKNGSTLVLQCNISSIITESDIVTQGKWQTVNKNNYKREDREFLEVDGELSIENGITDLDVPIDFATLTDPNLIEASLVAESGAPLGLQLIAKNDCKTCHNTKVKTIGPAYLSVAKKYADTEDNILMLVDKVKNGGKGIWGEELMNAHPELSDFDLKEMVKYVLSLANPENQQKGQNNEIIKFESEDKIDAEKLLPGAITKIWDIGSVNKMPTSVFSTKSKFAGVLLNYDNLTGTDFKDLNENFALTGEGLLKIEKSGEYGFRTWSDDGSLFYLHNRQIIDNDGNHGTEFKEATVFLEEGLHPFRLEFFQGAGGKFLSLNYKTPESKSWEVVPASIIYHETKKQAEIQGQNLPMANAQSIPGDQSPLTSMHPSFDVFQAKPKDFKPKVGGIDIMSNGNLVISTWDPRGPVYLIKNPKAENPEDIIVKEIASGFAEPLGVKVVNDVIYIMQKQELTKLIDHDGDEIIDEFQTLSDDWGVSANFHEFGFGLDYQDGYFYATLATGILPGGASMKNQHKHRGNVIKISEKDGSTEFIASGLRTPNGIGVGYNEQIFVADNQGDWLPSSKIVHVEKGAWYGSRSVDYDGTENTIEKLPVVWLPQDEIGNSPSTPSYLNVGPYKNQMIHGEVTHGGIKRVFVEEVKGQLQGCVFRFMQGLDAGINRIRWDGDHTLYAGGIGNPGNWAQSGKDWFGLQRIEYNSKSTFEMLAIRAKSNGIEIEFTEPLQEREGWNKKDYEIKQWYYKPTKDYGGPKLSEESLNIKSVSVSVDRTKVFLELEDMKENHVIYVRLKSMMVSDLEHSLWTTEAWYTMNKIPSDNIGFVTSAPVHINKHNSLTDKEKKEGWELLFDGTTMSHFRNFKKETIGKSWVIEDEAIHLKAKRQEGKWKVENGGDIITKEEYKNFDLKLEWKIGNCGNSGIFFNVHEGDYGVSYETGLEMQILDNTCHPDARFPQHRAGDLYDMKACAFGTVRPAGEWNKVRILSQNGTYEFWQNGYKVIEFNIGDEEWDSMLKNSKFATWSGFAKYNSGHIALQDHSDPVWFRNIKIKKL